jgi:predicted metal-dependent HD superfamily phosphohydrolase
MRLLLWANQMTPTTTPTKSNRRLSSTQCDWLVPQELEDELSWLYSSPPRAYHNLDHIRSVLESFDQVAEDVGWDDALPIHAAILFHDAIYDPLAKTNEAESAVRARQRLPKHNWPGTDAQLARVTLLIEATAHHGQSAPAVDDADLALFLDCDTAILGAEPAKFEVYDQAIATEFAKVPPELYRAGRKAFLAKTLASPRIFHSAYFRELYEAQARENLASALTRY